MWSRIAEVTATADTVRIRHEGADDPGCRMRAALLRWGTRHDGTADPTIVGISWQEPGGGILWGWPDETGRVLLRRGTDRAEVCSVLPPALSLALAFRRGGSEPGTRTLVIGSGFAARYAAAVASAVGCRVRSVEDPGEESAALAGRPDVLIEASGDPRNLEWAVRFCRDWGTVYSVGGALTTGPLDYYTHVHRRALAVIHVPERPLPNPQELEVVERGSALLASALQGITPEPGVVMQASAWPEGTPGRVLREPGGWGLLLVDGP
jgi:threonine dehydrogenase-like Zn-dependent dehydrogenase